MENIKHILLISGKRKCGKDHIANALKNSLGSLCQIIHISKPIKCEWSEKNNLDLDLLLSDDPYKEKFRRDMIKWSDEVRHRDYAYFCRTAMKEANASIVIVSDIRRKNDIKYFYETYGSVVKTIRINCDQEIRKTRGWIFSKGVDDVESECNLDDYEKWDLELSNDNKNTVHFNINLIVEHFKLRH